MLFACWENLPAPLPCQVPTAEVDDVENDVVGGGNYEEGIQPNIASVMVEGKGEVWESNGEENPAMAGGLRATIRMMAVWMKI